MTDDLKRLISEDDLQWILQRFERDYLRLEFGNNGRQQRLLLNGLERVVRRRVLQGTEQFTPIEDSRIVDRFGDIYFYNDNGMIMYHIGPTGEFVGSRADTKTGIALRYMCEHIGENVPVHRLQQETGSRQVPTLMAGLANQMINSRVYALVGFGGSRHTYRLENK